MASYLSYNGITLDIMRTNAYVQTPILSEDGGDQIGTRVLLDVDAIYSPGATSYSAAYSDGVQVAIPDPGNYAPATDVAVSAALLAKRAQLYYVVGGQVVIQSPANGAQVDISNGPSPIHCFTRLLTERTWRVNYRIETAIRDCAPAGIGLVSNRWRQTHQVGSDHLTTVHTRGVAVFRTDRLQSLGVTADYFRSVLLPPHIYDFQRVSIVASLSEIGNVLTYEVVDRERATQIGGMTGAMYGVRDFTCNLQVGTMPASDSGIASEMTLANLEIVVMGDRNSSRRGLHAYASRLAIEKLGIPPPSPRGKPHEQPGHRMPMIRSVNAGESAESPVVSLHVSAQYLPPKEGAGVFQPIAFDLLGYDPGTFIPNPGVDESIFLEGVLGGTNPQMPLGTRGHFDSMMFAQELKTTLARCQAFGTPEAVVRVPGYGPADEVAGEDPVTPFTYLANSRPFVNVSVGAPLFPVAQTKYSQEQTSPGDDDGAGPLNEGRADSSHKRHLRVVVAPVAGYSNRDDPPLVFRLGNSIESRTVDWTVEKIGAVPKIPHPRSNDRGEVLVAQEIVPAAPEIAPDGSTQVHRISGTYTYYNTARVGVGKRPLYMGAVPWADMTFEENLIRDPNYRHGFTDPTAEYTPPTGPVSDPEYERPPSGSENPTS